MKMKKYEVSIVLVLVYLSVFLTLSLSIGPVKADIFRQFCNAVAKGLANGPQAGACPTVNANTNTTPTVSSQTPPQCSAGQILISSTCIQLSPPTANAGPNQLVYSGSTVTLDGSGSTAKTPGASITGYSWSQTAGPSVQLQNTGTATPTFVAPILPQSQKSTPLTFSLTVSDSFGQISKPNGVTVTVKNSASNNKNT
jgi:K319-like protein